MKVAIVGGHLTPALAVIEELFERDSRLSVLYFGRKNTFSNDKNISLEYKTFSSLKNTRFVTLIAGRFNRYLSRSNFFVPFQLFIGIFQAFYYLVDFKPEVIVSFGGYLSIPVVFSGFLLRIPVISHEQTMSLGFANKINAFFSSKICVSWPLENMSSKKIVLTGLPLRKSILYPMENVKFAKYKNSKLPIIFITGGNQGSHFINDAVKNNLFALLKKYVLIHQCGLSEKYHDYQALRAEAEKLPEEYKQRYILETQFSPDDIGGIFLISAIVIARSGINTVCELLYLKKKAILIPLPFSAGGEQEKNAKMLKELGLARVIGQEEYNEKLLLDLIEELLKANGKKDLNNKYENLFKEAAKKITDEIYGFHQQKKNS